MQEPIVEVYLSLRQRGILEDLRIMLSKEAGVTLIGNRLTIRYRHPDDGTLCEVHTIIEYIDDGLPDPDEEETLR